MLFLKLDAHSAVDKVILSFQRDFKQAGLLSVTGNLLMLVPTLYMMQVYDRVLNSRNVTTLVMLTFILLVLVGLQSMLDYQRTRLLQGVGLSLDNQLRDKVFAASIQANLREGNASPTQGLSDLSALRQFLGSSVVTLLFDAPFTPIFFIAIGLVHPLLAVFSVSVAVVVVGLAMLNERVTKAPMAEVQKVSGLATQLVNGQVRNAEVAEAMGMLNGLRRKWYGVQDKLVALQSLATQRSGQMAAWSKYVRTVSQSLILGMGAWLSIEDMMTGGAMIAGSVLLGRGLAPIEQLIANWKVIYAARDAHVRLKALMEKYPDNAPQVTLPAPTGLLTVEGVDAGPPGGEKPILKGLKFRINPGDVVGVVGPSAAGKSSLARLLVGLWSPSEGHVRLDSADINEWNRNDLGQYIGYLPQDVELFQGSVAENIARFGEMSSDKVIQAAQRAGVHEMILRLPNGYETVLSPGATSISAGQRQRIGLARALYGEVRLVVLDEPNANLDEPGEMALAKALVELKQRQCTVVVITHRRSVLQVVDKLMVMRDGSMVAYGPRDAVIEALKKEGAR